MKKNSYKKSRSGFSFIEVLMAVAILALVIVGVLTMTTVNIKTNSFALHHTRAVQLAEEGLEHWMRVDFQALEEQFTSSPNLIEPFGSISKYPQFSRNITLAADGAGNYLITARVRWRSQGHNSSPVTLTVLRAPK